MAMAMARAKFSSFCIYIVVLCSISVNLVLSSAAMPGKSKSASPAVHIVFMEKPRGVEPEAYHIQTLASVLGRYFFSSLLFYSPPSLWKLTMNFGTICWFSVKRLLKRLLCIVTAMLPVDSPLGLLPIRSRRFPVSPALSIICFNFFVVYLSLLDHRLFSGFLKEFHTLELGIWKFTSSYETDNGWYIELTVIYIFLVLCISKRLEPLVCLVRAGSWSCLLIMQWVRSGFWLSLYSVTCLHSCLMLVWSFNLSRSLPGWYKNKGYIINLVNKLDGCVYLISKLDWILNCDSM